MNVLGSITQGVKDFCSEFAGAHVQLGSSVGQRVNGIFTGTVNDSSVLRGASPLIAAFCLQVISHKSLLDRETFSNNIDRLIESGDFSFLETKRLTIPISKIVTNPDAILDKMAAYIEANPNSPLNIKFQDDDKKTMPGVDAGGLSRQLIADLFQEIQHSSVIKFEKLSNDRFIPAAKGEKLSSEETKKWKNIGIVLRHCVVRGNLLIGPIFEDSFFEALLAFDTTKIDFHQNLSVYKILRKDHQDEIAMIDRFEKLITKETLTEADKQAAYFMVNPDEIDCGSLVSPKKQLRAKLVSILTPKFQKYLEPLRCIAKECKLAHSLDNDPKALCRKLQGRVDKAFVKSKISFNTEHPNADYLHRWISECTDEDLKALIKAATGASSIGSTPIQVAKTGGSMACFHTCGHTVDLPTKRYAEYIHFKAMLTLSIEYALAEGFQSL